MKRIGLQPGNNGSYFQDVPMVETTADEAATTMTLATAKRRPRAEVRHRLRSSVPAPARPR